MSFGPTVAQRGAKCAAGLPKYHALCRAAIESEKSFDLKKHGKRQLVLFLAAQMTVAPLRVAAAAACLLARSLLSLQDECCSEVVPSAGTSFIMKALGRPDFVVAMNACRNAEHAAGVLAVVAAGYLREADWTNWWHKQGVMAALAPCLASALAAPSNDILAGGCWGDSRCEIAADLLWTLAQQSDGVLVDLPHVLHMAAEFLQRLDSRFEQAMQLPWTCSETIGWRYCNALNGAGRLVRHAVTHGTAAGSLLADAATAAAGSMVAMLQHMLERLAIASSVDHGDPLLLAVSPGDCPREPFLVPLPAMSAAAWSQMYTTAVQALQHLLQPGIAEVIVLWPVMRLIQSLISTPSAQPNLIIPSVDLVAACAAAAGLSQLRVVELCEQNLKANRLYLQRAGESFCILAHRTCHYVNTLTELSFSSVFICALIW